jgi:hypothetical protein
MSQDRNESWIDLGDYSNRGRYDRCRLRAARKPAGWLLQIFDPASGKAKSSMPLRDVQLAKLLDEDRRIARQGRDVYYILPGGEPDYELPSSATLRDVGGKIVFGRFSVWHRSNTGGSAWVVDERIGKDIGDVVSIEEFSRFRDAVALAKKLHREGKP